MWEEATKVVQNSESRIPLGSSPPSFHEGLNCTSPDPQTLFPRFSRANITQADLNLQGLLRLSHRTIQEFYLEWSPDAFRAGPRGSQGESSCAHGPRRPHASRLWPQCQAKHLSPMSQVITGGPGAEDARGLASMSHASRSSI